MGEVSDGQGAPDPVYYANGLGRVSRSQDGSAYYHADAQGSTRVLTEDDGTALESYTYDAWGNEKAGQPSEANDYRYCGQWDYSTDENTVWQPQGVYRTGLMHLGCRYYDPELGRFIQPDPLLGNPYNPQSLNRYTYCANSPLNWIDRDGRRTHYIGGSGFIGIGPGIRIGFGVVWDDRGNVGVKLSITTGAGLGAGAGIDYEYTPAPDIYALRGIGFGVDCSYWLFSGGGSVGGLYPWNPYWEVGGGLGPGWGIVFGPETDFVW